MLRTASRFLRPVHKVFLKDGGQPARLAWLSSVNEDFSPLTDDEAKALVNSVNWYHRFELRPGVVTPGVSDFLGGPHCSAMGAPEDLSGRRALDIGTWDGPIELNWSAAQEVVALDIQDPKRVGFAVARRVLGSRVEHVQASVYELSRGSISAHSTISFFVVYTIT